MFIKILLTVVALACVGWAQKAKDERERRSYLVLTAFCLALFVAVHLFESVG